MDTPHDMQEDKKENGAVPPSDALAECEKKRDEYLAGWQRAKADFLNYKKDEAMRLQEFMKYGHEEFMRELIGVLDSFDLAISYLEKEKAPPTLQSESRPEGVGIEKAGSVEKGIYMIRSQIEDVMKRNGLARIPIKRGSAFDTAMMESVGEIESGESPGTVAEEIEPGYQLYGKVLRPARVQLSK